MRPAGQRHSPHRGFGAAQGDRFAHDGGAVARTRSARLHAGRLNGLSTSYGVAAVQMLRAFRLRREREFFALLWQGPPDSATGAGHAAGCSSRRRKASNGSGLA